MNKHTLLTLTFFLCGLWLFAQEGDTYTISEKSKCTVEGTSTVSDWTVEVQEVKGEVMMSDADGLSISSVKITVPVKSMKGRADAMDEKTRNAFKAETYPNVIFESDDIKVVKGEGDTFTLETTGSMSMAGHTETVTVNFNGKKEEGNYVFSGEIPLKLSTYKMEAPTAFFGSLEVADPVKVIFSLVTVK